jgi:hypothetical protein
MTIKPHIIGACAQHDSAPPQAHFHFRHNRDDSRFFGPFMRFYETHSGLLFQFF